MMADDDRTLSREKAVGDYVLQRKLGSGGFGAVFEARHKTNALTVYALKRIPFTLQDADLYEKKALYPARVAAESLHVMPVRDYFFDAEEDFFYLVTELMPHGDLRHFLARHAQLPIAQALDLAIGIARGLAAIHDQGIVHFDLKPGNVLMDRKDGRWVPKIADFGLARSTGTIHLNQAASIGYAAPEQWSLRDATGPHSDLFALGMILYELLTGRRATEATTPEQYVAWLMAQRLPQPPSQVRGELAGWPDLDALVREALTFNPAERRITAAEIVRRVARAQRAADSVDSTPLVAERGDATMLADTELVLDIPSPLIKDPTQTLASRPHRDQAGPPPRTHKRRRAYAAAAALGTMLALMAALLYERNTQPPPALDAQDRSRQIAEITGASEKTPEVTRSPTPSPIPSPARPSQASPAPGNSRPVAPAPDPTRETTPDAAPNPPAATPVPVPQPIPLPAAPQPAPTPAPPQPVPQPAPQQPPPAPARARFEYGQACGLPLESARGPVEGVIEGAVRDELRVRRGTLEPDIRVIVAAGYTPLTQTGLGNGVAIQGLFRVCGGADAGACTIAPGCPPPCTFRERGSQRDNRDDAVITIAERIAVAIRSGDRTTRSVCSN